MVVAKHGTARRSSTAPKFYKPVNPPSNFTIYFAHSMRSYHTAEEGKWLAEINRVFPKATLINPSTTPQDAFPKNDPMPYFFKLIDGCDLVIATEFRKHVGYGVWAELHHAWSTRVPVLLLRDGVLHYIDPTHCQLVDTNDWKIYYGRINP